MRIVALPFFGDDGPQGRTTAFLDARPARRCLGSRVRRKCGEPDDELPHVRLGTAREVGVNMVTDTLEGVRIVDL
ncbi:hypothetical protein [Streptomyces purpurogeneiscleroticus]|uniref:hypothetical protein n=1 Tax=Streptomyces purpurogeneiscleroticus TaxID=68259 RepID=UPI001CBDB1B1|nr:hypothetical protein [Streptomyces purpurogeneiscleroticus]